MESITPEDAERFWSKVSRIEGPDDCAVWTDFLPSPPFDYGRFFWRGKTRAAHHVGWFLTRGPIPAGMWVLHHCDNPPCVAHLFLGTQKDNVADMDAKGRRGDWSGDKNGSRKWPERQVRGERQGSAKLSEQDVRTVLAEISAGIPQTVLARRYGVTKGAISHIKHGRNWRHISHQGS